jgi:hypothetical protein
VDGLDWFRGQTGFLLERLRAWDQANRAERESVENAVSAYVSAELQFLFAALEHRDELARRRSTGALSLEAERLRAVRLAELSAEAVSGFREELERHAAEVEKKVLARLAAILSPEERAELGRRMGAFHSMIA